MELGWGHTSYEGQLSRILQKITLNVLTQLECKKYYGDIMVNAMCAYAKGKDACQVKLCLEDYRTIMFK